MGFKNIRRKIHPVDPFNTPYRVSVPTEKKCEVILREKMEKVKEFKYLGTVLCKYGDGKKNKRAVEGIESFARVVRER